MNPPRRYTRRLSLLKGEDRMRVEYFGGAKPVTSVLSPYEEERRTGSG